MCRLAAELWNSDGEKRFLGVRTEKGMEDPIEKLHDSAQGLAVWNFSLAVVETAENALGFIALCYAGISAPQSALSAPWFSQGNWEDPERGGKSEKS